MVAFDVLGYWAAGKLPKGKAGSRKSQDEVRAICFSFQGFLSPHEQRRLDTCLGH